MVLVALLALEMEFMEFRKRWCWLWRQWIWVYVDEFGEERLWEYGVLYGCCQVGFLRILSTNDTQCCRFCYFRKCTGPSKCQKPKDVVRFLVGRVDWSVICILWPPLSRRRDLGTPFFNLFFVHCPGLDTPFLFWPKRVYMYKHTNEHSPLVVSTFDF